MTRTSGTPTMKVRNVDMETLLPDPANARKHSRKNIDAIRASLRRFGQQRALVIDRQNVIMVGNGQYEAMTLEGWERCDVVVFEGTPEEARAYAIADNRTAELAEWDTSTLVATLGTITGPLIDATGFDAADLAKLPGWGEPTPPDDEPPVPKGKPKNRTLFLEYDADTHEWLMDVIEAYKTRRGIADTATAVIALVAQATRKTPPA